MRVSGNQILSFFAHKDGRILLPHSFKKRLQAWEPTPTPTPGYFPLFCPVLSCRNLPRSHQPRRQLHHQLLSKELASQCACADANQRETEPRRGFCNSISEQRYACSGRHCGRLWRVVFRHGHPKEQGRRLPCRTGTVSFCATAMAWMCRQRNTTSKAHITKTLSSERQPTSPTGSCATCTRSDATAWRRGTVSTLQHSATPPCSMFTSWRRTFKQKRTSFSNFCVTAARLFHTRWSELRRELWRGIYPNG